MENNSEAEANLKAKMVTSPTRMWIKAFDVLLTRMKDSGFDFRRVSATGVSGQQHGSVYWSRVGVDERLDGKQLDPLKSLNEQLDDDCFTFEDSPIWMDSSTDAECREMEKAVRELSDGAETVASITGAKGVLRIHWFSNYLIHFFIHFFIHSLKGGGMP